MVIQNKKVELDIDILILKGVKVPNLKKQEKGNKQIIIASYNIKNI